MCDQPYAGAAQVRRSSRVPEAVERFGDFATDQQLRDADPYLMAIYQDDPVTGRPGAPAGLWDLVYMNQIYGWSDQPPKDAPDTTAHTVLCQEPTCHYEQTETGRTIFLNAKFQEIAGLATPKGQLRRPPLCHNTPWAALAAQLSHHAITYNVQFLNGFIQAYCWSVANIWPGHNYCNATGVKVTTSTVGGTDARNAEAIYQQTIAEFTARNLPCFVPLQPPAPQPAVPGAAPPAS